MLQKISPVSRLSGSVRLPGDKSISHRYAMLASIAEGETVIHNYSTGADCHSTLGCVRSLGIPVEVHGTDVTIQGRGLDGLSTPASDLDAGNSGSTIRMYSGILAAQPFTSRIIGDESLSRRPMDRIMKPLGQMGATIEAREGRFPPLTITGGALHPIEYHLPVPSAQVKTCVLFGGIYADGETVVHEPIRSRDHSEIALREFGADIAMGAGKITIAGRPKLTGRELLVPSDLSSAAFFLVAALLVPGSSIVIEAVGLNPTRSGLLDFLMSVGAPIRVLSLNQINGEMVGSIQVTFAPVKGGVIEGAITAALIDEIPVLSILGAVSEQGLVVRDAGELRIKETDRIATVAENLGRMGVKVDVTPDGMVIPGRQKFRAAELDSFGDHRIAMAFAVASLAADGECAIRDPGAASVSFPGFFATLDELSGNRTPA